MRVIRVSVGLAVGGLLVLGLVDMAASQSHTEVARMLRIEWKPVTETWGPPRLEGHSYNDSTYRIGSIRLRLETLAGSNQPVGQTLVWVYVTVPARGQAAFSLRRPSSGEGFRLSVESFVLIAREGIGETP